MPEHGSGSPAATGSGSSRVPQGPAHRHRLYVTFGVAMAVIGLDQASKSLAVSHLRHPVHLFGPLGLALGYNSGAAFSLFTGAPAVLLVVALVLVVVLGWVAWRTRSSLVALALGLVLGGALGNVSDRVFRGHHGAVVDFVTLTHWPTFNVADASITCGVVLLVAVLLFRPSGGGSTTDDNGQR